MAQLGLLARLNCREYKNWMKAGHCLLMLQDRLQGYTAKEMQAFHRQLAGQITAPTPRRRCQCRATGRQFQPSCPVCAQWKELILAHHNNINGDIYWGNSDPSLWPTHYWEVAKVYMPRGQATQGGSDRCDIAALLNLINTCDYFRVPNLSTVKEMIKCRNKLMHSTDMKVSTDWLKHFGQKMHELITAFIHVPGLVREGEKMHEVLLTDWSIEELDVFQVDGLGIPSAQFQCLTTNQTNISLSPAETEIILIRQLIEELYLDIEEQGSLTKENEDKVNTIKNFLSQNKDLTFSLHGDLMRLDNLKNHVALTAKGPINTQRFAAFLVVVILAFLTAIYLG